MENLPNFNEFVNESDDQLNEGMMDKELTAAISTIMRICDEKYKQFFDRGKKATADTWKDLKEDVVKMSKTMEKFS